MGHGKMLSAMGSARASIAGILYPVILGHFRGVIYSTDAIWCEVILHAIWFPLTIMRHVYQLMMGINRIGEIR